jgi:hypothetical protein
MDTSPETKQELVDPNELRRAADRIRSLVEKCCSNILAIGGELLVVKTLLDHGKFGKWIQSEFGWTQRTAQNYMRAAQAFGPKAKLISHLPVTTIYKLATPTTTVAREQVLERIEKGEQLTVKGIDEIVHEVGEIQRQNRVTANWPALVKEGRETVSRLQGYEAEIAALAEQAGVSRRELAEAIGDDLPDEPIERAAKGAGGLEWCRTTYLDRCARPDVDLDSEQEIIIDAFREIAGKRAMKQVSTLPQDGRSEGPMDHPTPLTVSLAKKARRS